MKLNNLFRGIDISSSALSAHRRAMELVSENIANVETTRTEEGGPYQRQSPLYEEIEGLEFSDMLFNMTSRLSNTSNRHIRQGRVTGAPAYNRAGGVNVESLRPAEQEYRLEHDPMHPDADANGYVRYPKINILEEMVQLMQVSRSYEASVTAMQAAKSMARKALEI